MEKVLEFKNFNQWVEKATCWLRGYDMKNIICKDQKKRICKKGKHFMRARDENAFPVEVYLLDKKREIEKLENDISKIKIIISKFVEINGLCKYPKSVKPLREEVEFYRALIKKKLEEIKIIKNEGGLQ